MRSFRVPYRAAFVVLSLIALGLVGAASAWAGTRSLEDATGARVPADGKARGRIVALAPSLAELAADFLGAELERLVGVSEFSDYPATLRKVPSVGPFHQFDVEKVAAMSPDLVLATLDGNSRDQVMRLRELGFAVVVVRTSTLDQIAESMELVGAAVTGARDRGDSMAAQFRKGIESLREQGKSMPNAGTRVLIQVGDDPLVVAGAGSFLNEALRAVGFKNAYGDLSGAWPRPSLEDALARNPQAIIVLTMGGEVRWARRSAQRWNQRKKLDAVKSGRVYLMEGDLLLRPTLRLLEGLSLLQKRLGEGARS